MAGIIHTPRHRLFLPILIAILFLWGLFQSLMIATAAPETTHLVTTLNDEFDTCATGSGCSLREAIHESESGDGITFAVTGTINISHLGQLDLNKDLTIDGRGQITVSGGYTTQIFHIYTATTPSVVVTLTQLTIAHGQADASHICGDSRFVCGGGILIDGRTSSAIISQTTFLSNTAAYGGAIENNEGHLTLFNSQFHGNQATEDGGAIENYFGSTTISNSVLSHNTATKSGGAIHNVQGQLAVSVTQFANNAATGLESEGGGISNYSGLLTLSATTFTSHTGCLWGGDSCGRNSHTHHPHQPNPRQPRNGWCRYLCL